MRIVFVGAVEFSRHCLQELLKHRADVVAVLTLERVAANGHADYADVGELAGRYGIALHRIADINHPATASLLESLQPDVIFILGWSQLVSASILRIPRFGCIGSHPTLLPKHRGRHPLIWALVEGLSESGLTFFYLNERADAGDILWQRAFSIAAADDAATLYQKIKALASEAIAEFLPHLLTGAAPRRPQDERQATYWRRRTPSDGEIHWEEGSGRIHNLIRALTRPYVGAHTSCQGEKMVVWRSEVVRGDERLGAGLGIGAPPGTVISADRAIPEVRTGDGLLRLVEYELPHGRLLGAGERLGEHRERAGHLCAS